jgi:LDH2 family malate/lactate/ureidoglycolate dehydrogenase
MGNTTEGYSRCSYEELRDWCSNVFLAGGVRRDDAVLGAEMLVRTDARGIHTHGLMRLRSYLEKLSTGDVSSSAIIEERFSNGFGIVDAQGALGQIAGQFTVRKAIERTRDQAFAVYMLRDTGHLGAIGMYALLAAEVDRVALILQSTAPLIAMTGARGRMLGINPIALGAPRLNAVPIVIDVSSSGAARGNVLFAARTGRPIPEGWAIDSAGQPTTDAKSALEGALLSFGGHKGMMIAMIVEIMAGSLSGKRFISELSGSGAMRSAPGHLNAFILVINPDLVAGRAEYEAHVSAWTEHYKANGGPHARIPGERAAGKELDARRNGVPLAANVIAELRELGSAYGVPFSSTVKSISSSN